MCINSFSPIFYGVEHCFPCEETKARVINNSSKTIHILTSSVVFVLNCHTTPPLWAQCPSSLAQWLSCVSGHFTLGIDQLELLLFEIIVQEIFINNMYLTLRKVRGKSKLYKKEEFTSYSLKRPLINRGTDHCRMWGNSVFHWLGAAISKFC